jgi:hypothetical protein
VGEKEEEVKEKAEVTGWVARRLLATMSRQPVTKLWEVSKEGKLCLSYFSLSKPSGFH